MVMGLDSEKVCLGFCLGLKWYLVYDGSNMDVGNYLLLSPLVLVGGL